MLEQPSSSPFSADVASGAAGASGHADAVEVLLDADGTAAHLPWHALTEELAMVLRDPGVVVPARMVLPLASGGTLFVMPANDSQVALTKLITFTPGNVGTGRPTIQGAVVVFDVATGTRRLVQKSARNVVVHNNAASPALAEQARAMGATARTVEDPNDALAECPLVVTCTPANGVVLHAQPREDAFIAAVGAFTPTMVELSAALCRHLVQTGNVVVDTQDALHEAGDLLLAGLDVAAMPTLGDVLRGVFTPGDGPTLFKSCGWGGWDLAAARVALLRQNDVQGKGASAPLNEG